MKLCAYLNHMEKLSQYGLRTCVDITLGEKGGKLQDI